MANWWVAPRSYLAPGTTYIASPYHKGTVLYAASGGSQLAGLQRGQRVAIDYSKLRELCRHTVHVHEADDDCTDATSREEKCVLFLYSSIVFSYSAIRVIYRSAVIGSLCPATDCYCNDFPLADTLPLALARDRTRPEYVTHAAVRQ